MWNKRERRAPKWERRKAIEGSDRVAERRYIIGETKRFRDKSRVYTSLHPPHPLLTKTL